ncbi:MAG TPA: hypothetical protein VEX41_01775 [Candidatus Eisenbacteria bacterium]|nr:hypothetical protein [Candidatus Eisenbacteria bacterium]
MSAVDLAYQLRAGAAILAGQGIPTADTWTFTVAGAAWHDQQWLAQAFLAAAFAAGGWAGLAILRAALVALAFGLLLAAVRTRAPRLASRTAALLVIASFIVAAPALALRPQLIAIVLFAATLLVLAGRRAHPRRLWLVPILAALWANVHGSFPLAILLAGLAWLEDLADGRPLLDLSPWRHVTLGVALAAAAATLLNPIGFGVWGYAVSVATNSTITARVSEWLPPSPATPSGFVLFASVAAVIGLVAFLYARREVGRWRPSWPVAMLIARPPWPAMVTLFVFAVLGMSSGRGIAWWPFVAAVTVAGLLEARAAATLATEAPTPASLTAAPGTAPPRPAALRTAERRSPLNALIAVVLVLAGLALLPMWRPTGAAGAPIGLLTEAPQGIAAELASGRVTGDRVWNPQLWGSWLELTAPTMKVATDSRIELFPPEIWDQADQVATASGAWLEILDRYAVAAVVAAAEPEGSLDQALATTPGWVLAYRDPDGAIWVRTPN